jgi:dephospho-CoA kinase
MAREIIAPGGKAIPLIKERFGDILFNEDGSLDRAAVRAMIYDDPDKKALYESCTTKLVLEEIAEIKDLCEKAGEDVIFYDIPLLFETKTESDYDAVWVVTANVDNRIRRVMERSKLDEAAIRRIMDSQLSEEDKIAKADHVIYNNGTIADLYRECDEALKTFLK